ncbi:hypothetical protein C0993_010132 [Termitomyces sp. T159_Od127]|nr:hypothetical protein C0993_010132 [Termitomyces sp. T159_Od127]
MPHTPQTRSNKLTRVRTAAAHMLRSARLGLDAQVLRLSRLHGERPDMYDIEPNYSVHLQVAAHIKAKKANTPREAAAVARLTNHCNPHIAILALASSTPSLASALVGQCNYPFHLQISTKEFLNELVQHFPERPPPFSGPVMSCILELIHTWKNTICVESRWKEDLGNNQDMHRLLTFKGYRLRELNRHQSLATPPQ